VVLIRDLFETLPVLTEKLKTLTRTQRQCFKQSANQSKKEKSHAR
jgi:hypothetical protein